MADADAFIADIATGHFDDELALLREAVESRANSGDVELAWSLRFGDIAIDRTNKFGNGLTVGAVIKLDLMGKQPRQLDPLVSEVDRLVIVLAYVMDRDDATLEAAGKTIREARFDDITVTEYVERDLPKGSSLPAAP